MYFRTWTSPVHDTETLGTEAFVELVRFDAQGLLPVVVQDVVTRDLLMVAWMNRDALQLTMAKGQAVFWSRSRSEIWYKGATSGNYLDVESLRLDCDGDTLLLWVRPHGPACHTGARTCFFRGWRKERPQE